MSLALAEQWNSAYSEAPSFSEEYSIPAGLQGILDSLKRIPRGVTSRTVFVIANEPLLMRAKAKLTEFLSLSDDWDSYSARAVPPSAIDKARQLLDLVERREGLSENDSAAPFSLVPIPRGGVQIEWRRRGSALEVEIGPQGQISLILDRGTLTDRFIEKDPATAGDVLDFLESLLAT
ncbi:MAG TPA: hypothetical protein PLB02_00400 [Thermoanaerobaculia bacterium]|nr:hypothetical protein [Thermoanaerobaculia bacterium]